MTIRKLSIVGFALAAAAATAASSALASDTCKVGARMSDGTVCAGLSPDTNKAMYVLPADAALTMKWDEATAYATQFEGHGQTKGTFRVPTKNELDVLFRNKAKIGGFNRTGSDAAGWYWSSTPERDCHCAWDQRFSNGFRVWHPKYLKASVRLVRD